MSAESAPEIISFSNFSLFNLPEDVIKERSDNWKKFWKENSSELNDNLEEFTFKNNYQSNAYREFLNHVNTQPLFSILLPNESVGLTHDEGKWVAKSIITLDKEEKDEVLDTDTEGSARGDAEQDEVGPHRVELVRGRGHAEADNDPLLRDGDRGAVAPAVRHPLAPVLRERPGGRLGRGEDQFGRRSQGPVRLGQHVRMYQRSRS